MRTLRLAAAALVLAALSTIGASVATADSASAAPGRTAVFADDWQW